MICVMSTLATHIGRTQQFAYKHNCDNTGNNNDGNRVNNLLALWPHTIGAKTIVVRVQ